MENDGQSPPRAQTDHQQMAQNIFVNNPSSPEEAEDITAEAKLPDEKVSRGATPAPMLTSFSDTLNIDEDDMKDVQLYEEDEEPVSRPDQRATNGRTIAFEPGEDSEFGNQKTKATVDLQSESTQQKSSQSTEFESLSLITNSQLGKTVIIHSNDESAEETFERLKLACMDGLSYKDIVESLFNTLVGGGPFDLESRYVIDSPENVNRMLDLADMCPQHVQAEIWSIFVAIVKKSFPNLETASKAGLISKLLERLPEADSVIVDLLIQLLNVLTSYSISVKEFKLFLRALQASDGAWRRNSIKLLDVMQEMPKREGPDVFFSFPGKILAGIFIPPLTRWPHQNGWTFSTWFRMDPLNSVYFEREKPFLFSFSTSKGTGYYCYFMGGCLVLRFVRAPGKEVMKCVKFDLAPRKWYHVALSFVYSRWAKGEVHCFIDGCLAEVIDANWPVSSTNEHFDRCVIGCGSEPDASEAFSGQMAAVYVFSQSITPQQAICLNCLGPSYQSHFKYEAESNLPDNYKKLLFDGKLNESLLFAYCPKDCHGQLVLSHIPTTSKSAANSFFVQVPHAIMKNGVTVIITHSIHNSLHSVGGIQMLLPFFSQIDLKTDDQGNLEICTILLSVIGTLLTTSVTAQQQFVQFQGFSVIASQLATFSSSHLSIVLLETLIFISKSFINFQSGIPLLKQLMESVFFASQLWIRADSSVQIRLYDFLANEFFSNPNLLQIVRRTQTVAILMNTLKKYYWIAKPSDVKNALEDTKRQLDRSVVVQIRTCILQLIDHFMFKLPPDCDEKDVEREEEFQRILNFVSLVREDDNLYDVLSQTMRQLSDHPAILVPAFDKKKAICVIFKLISSSNELIRIPALKMFGYYLCRSTQKRKNESINQRNLFYLLTEKLMLNTRTISLATYNALYEILVEQICPEILFVKHEESPLDSSRFENPQLLKVIAQLISQGEETPELNRVKKLFLQDMIKLCKDSRENRRIILQMSVWQEWLISLAYVFPENEEQNLISELVYQLFSILLFHAIRLEFGGWRVWVDTMAIAHSKVSWQKYRREVAVQEQKSIERAEALRAEGESSEQSVSALYRTPEFVWSNVQIRFLSDLLVLIRSVVQEWKESATAMADHLNNSDNQVFIANTVHILSQLTDSLVMACGGLLPLLAAATAPNSELDIFDTTQQELSISDAAFFLEIFAELADVFIFNSAINLSELEQEKNMPAGGILRQSLRLASTVAVRNILSCISRKSRVFEAPTSKFEAIHKFIKDKSIAPEQMDHLLQVADLQRLKGAIYRDMEETKQAQFLALAVVYFLSVLMVSRYRDILEPPTPSAAASDSPPKFDRKTNGHTEKAQKRQGTVAENKQKKRTSTIAEDDEETTLPEPSTAESADGNDIADADADDRSSPVQPDLGIASIQLNDTAEMEAAEDSDQNKYEPSHLSRFNAGDLPQQSSTNSAERRQYLTDNLKNSVEPVIPLFREILSDFRPFLQKTLLGTHGQEIMNDGKVMQTLKGGGVIEVVMLLCSQEWQTSLQKHAGLAFIELVNEGRLMAHATRDHILRVANEADFILNRLRAEDVSKHAQFESESNEQMNARKTEEQLTEQLILSAKRREFILATKLLEKIHNMLTSPTGAWFREDQNKMNFTKLDVWEDDSRRRRRFIYNPYGQKHSIVQNTSALDQNSDFEKKLKDLAHNMMAVTGQMKGNVAQELIEESEIEKWLKEENEIPEPKEGRTTYSTTGTLLAPGISIPGIITLTSSDLYFDADEEHPLFKQNVQSLRYCDFLHSRWHFQEIRAIFLRRYLLQYTALELFLAARTAIMFAFQDTETVRKVVSILPPCGIGVKYGLPQSRKSSLMTPWQLFKHSNMPQKWQQREISNFDYLMFLNTIAGRTYNDLNQYPVFPWILSNYTSEHLDLNDVSNFRDLSKPIGALSDSRRKHFQDRFSHWDDPEVPAFHYGTHYSTQAFTLNWLFRVEPFSTFFLELNGQRFDHSNRLFHSIAETWEHCLGDTHDVKELIPELFYMSEMLYNLNGYELGVREDGKQVSDVVLPPWAKNAEEFVKIHRRALESDLVSCQLNQWIDLIFGYKQRGSEAIRATNVFYYLTYEGALNLQSIENASLRESIQEQILNFGQTPAQLLTEPHPPRHSIMSVSPLMFKPSPDDLCMLMKFISNSPVVHITANTFQQIENPTIITIAQNLVFALNKWNPNYSLAHKPSSGVPFENEKSSQSSTEPISPSELPITVDPLLAVGNPTQKLPKRHLGDPFDQRFPVSSSNFVCTVDNKFIISCGYPDYSFRVIETENAQVRQVVYGHGDVVTCLARSESTLFADCYIASGSADCTVVLWHFSQQMGAIAGDFNAPSDGPTPRAVLTGHEAVITAISVSAEHGLVISGSKDNVLIHTTAGDLLRNIVCSDFGNESEAFPVTNILFNRDCQLAIFYGSQNVATFTTTGKQLHRPSTRLQEKVLCAVLNREGEFIVAGTECGRICILRLFPLDLLYTFAQTDSVVRSVAISTNQRLIFGGLDSGAIVVFNIDFNRFDSSRIRQSQQR